MPHGVSSDSHGSAVPQAWTRFGATPLLLGACSPSEALRAFLLPVFNHFLCDGSHVASRGQLCRIDSPTFSRKGFRPLSPPPHLQGGVLAFILSWETFSGIVCSGYFGELLFHTHARARAFFPISEAFVFSWTSHLSAPSRTSSSRVSSLRVY